MGKCGTLAIRRTERDGLRFMESAWEPTKEELIALAKGGKVILAISAPHHPVVSLSVSAPVPEILGITEIRFGDPRSRDVVIWDEIADRAVPFCLACNCVEGWIETYRGKKVGEGLEIELDEHRKPIIDRIEGTYTIRAA